MLKESQSPRYSVRRTHRTYSPQFKAEMVAACGKPGASVAALAMQHGINANVLHRWLKEAQQGMHRLGSMTAQADPSWGRSADFIPIPLNTALPIPDICSSGAESAPAPDIRIECQRAGLSVTICWPVSAAAQCAQVLRELLR